MLQTLYLDLRLDAELEKPAKLLHCDHSGLEVDGYSWHATTKMQVKQRLKVYQALPIPTCNICRESHVQRWPGS